MKYLFSLLLFINTNTTQAQDFLELPNFWYSDTIQVVLANGNTFYRIPRIGIYDPIDCKEDTILTALVPIPQYNHVSMFSGLTTHPGDDAWIYGYGYEIYSTTSSEDIGFWRIAKNNCIAIFLGEIPDSINAAATGIDELIYLVGSGVTAFDVNTETFNYIGELPPAMKAEGGLTLRGDKLLLSTISHNLIELDIANPLNSMVIMDFPPDAPPIEALYSINVTCDSTVTYAIGTSDTENKLYQIDFENETLIELCELDTYMFGAASEEWVYPECRLHVDLDQNDSSGANEFDFFTDTICQPPINIADEDTEVFSDIGVDSITIELMNILDVGAELLSISNGANLNITGNNTTKITLMNSGNTSELSFENALKDIQYLNNAANLTEGMRTVEVIAYAPGYVSEVAQSSILLTPSLVLTVTADLTTPDCFGDSNGAVSLTTNNGTTPYNYEWLDGTTDNFLTGLSTGFYPFTVTDAVGCEKNDSIFLPQPDTLQAIITNTGAPIVCASNGELTASAIGGTLDYTFLWNNGASNPNHTNLVADTYLLTVTDAENCTATAEYTLVSDTIFVNQSETLCEGDSFLFGNETFTSDTSFCLTLTSLSECDSVHCLDIQFLDTVLVQQFATICSGDVYDFEGLQLSTDTFICVNYPLASGCDSTICLNLEVTENLTNLSANFCEGDIYAFNGNVLTQAGIYFDTLAAFDGCDSVLLLDLVQIDSPIIDFEVEGSLCNQEFVTLNGGIHTTYDWSTGADNPQIAVSNGGEYMLSVTNDEGCSASASIVVEEGNVLEVFISNQSPICFNESNGWINVDSVAGGTAPYLYSIDGVSFQQISLFDNLASGSYQVIVEDLDGCQSTIDLTLDEPNDLFVELAENQTIRLGETIELKAITNDFNATILWSPSDFLSCDTCLQTIAIPPQSTEYQVIVTDANGCIATDVLSIFVNQQTGAYVPNVFSPNNDGINDYFFVFADGSIASVSTFRVFDRWGSLLFETAGIFPNDEIVGWNGLANGELLDAGVYIYFIEVLRVDGATEILKGEVLLIR